MSAYNAEQARCAKIIADEFKEVETLPPSFTLDRAKKFIKHLKSILKDLYNPKNEDEGMADILLIFPLGAYDGVLPKIEDYIDKYKGASSNALEFSYNTAATAVGAEFGIKKGIVDLICRALPCHVWEPHLTDTDGEHMALKRSTSTS